MHVERWKSFEVTVLLSLWEAGCDKTGVFYGIIVFFFCSEFVKLVYILGFPKLFRVSL